MAGLEVLILLGLILVLLRLHEMRTVAATSHLETKNHLNNLQYNLTNTVAQDINSLEKHEGHDLD